ncbi:MAG: Tyrosine-protein kinase EpsD (EC [uncultured Thiotrichaceae bacterium]|uniref:non-specific protein-tyrosine kinase n=1 Tax=uncultured Thiotrichaceae bacterium TaxID=298394 RepID=A0A6S6U874_9GAMM|nr:MAG: Tyrosine-protein kinase EpsD (EC [uncultured Thiotrichaceae bacterium]
MQSQAENQIIEIENNHGNTDLSSSLRSKPSLAQESPSATEKNEVKTLLQSIADRKWFVITITLLAILLSVVVSLSMTPTYRAETILKIVPEKNNILAFDVTTSGQDTASEQYNRTQQRLIKSKALARIVIDKMEINDLLAQQLTRTEKPFFEESIDKIKAILQAKPAVVDGALSKELSVAEVKPADIERLFISSLKVEPLGKSYLLELTYDSTDPEFAASVLNTITDSYIKMNLQNRVDSASHAKTFLGSELEEVKSKLDESEKIMIDFEKSHRIVNSGDGGSALMKQKLSSINAALTRATQARIAAEAAYEQRGANPSIKTVKVVAVDSSALKLLERQLAALNKKYQENLKIYKAGYPLMQEIQSEINGVKASIVDEKNAIRSRQQQLSQNRNSANNNAANATNALATRVRAAKANEAALAEELEKVKSSAIADRDNSLKYKALEKEVINNRELYESLLKRKKEVGVAEGVDKNNISIVDAAVAPLVPHNPDVKLNMILGGTLGLLFASLLAIVMGHTDQRIKSTEDIGKVTDIPVLGTFPLVKAKDRRNGAILVSERPSSSYAEAFRTLRTNLMFATPDGLPKILHVTSSEPGEGKSNTALNLAAVFAQSQKSVLLIDADLRKPSLHRYMGISGSKGLGDYLQNGLAFPDVETNSFIPGVTVIAGQAIESSPADLLSSDRMVDLLDEASDRYDLIIIDSPPVMGLADSLVLANRSTASLVVVASHETKQSQLTTTLNRLRLGYGNVVGFVLTKAKNVKVNEYEYDYGGEHNRSSKQLGKA